MTERCRSLVLKTEEMQSISTPTSSD